MRIALSEQCPAVDPRRSLRVRSNAIHAFTMIEIAISLAVIGFAMVAIIGILPFGMNTQRENREETIVNQDASIFLNALRSGASGLDDLTNYVLVITNSWTEYDQSRTFVGSGVNWYTTSNSWNSSETVLTNGSRIIGLLSTPKYLPLRSSGGFVSNYVAAVVRSMGGSATEKFPQDNVDAREMGLKYRLISEVMTYGSPINETVVNNVHYWDWVRYGRFPTNSHDYAVRAAFDNYSTNLYNHLHDVRLIFRWPVLPNGTVPIRGSRLSYSTTVSGRLMAAGDRWNSNQVLFFIQPTTYTTNAL